MTVTVFSETNHPFCYLVSEEGHGNLSRDMILIAASQTLTPGAVLGRSVIVAGATSSSVADASNTGNGTLTLDGTAPVAVSAVDGVYRAVALTATLFAVFDPKGAEIGRVATGATFNNQIKFALAAGGTAFAVGDAFSITVGIEYEADMQFSAINFSATDGTQNAFAIAGYGVTTGAGATAQIAATMRNSEVRLSDLVWPAGATAIQKAEALDQLRARGIIAR